MNLIENDYNLALLLFPHVFTRVDHQEENSSVFTLEINTTRFSRIKVVWLLAFKLKWRWSVFRFPDVGNPACRCRVTSLWGCPSVVACLLGVVWRSKFFSRSFRLSRVSSEIWRGCWFNLQNSARCYGCEAFWSSPSFKEARDFRAEQREREQLGVSFRRRIRSLPLDALPMKVFL